MKIIFLDFDGVLNSDAWLGSVQTRETWCDPAAMARLNKLVDVTGAEVVVSSSWRQVDGGLGTVRGMLLANGFQGNVLDTTPIIRRAGSRLLPETADVQRGEEIRMWLNDHPGVVSYVVLDDDGDMDLVRDHFVQTDFEEGLLDEHIERAVAILMDS